MKFKEYSRERHSTQELVKLPSRRRHHSSRRNPPSQIEEEKHRNRDFPTYYEPVPLPSTASPTRCPEPMEQVRNPFFPSDDVNIAYPGFGFGFPPSQVPHSMILTPRSQESPAQYKWNSMEQSSLFAQHGMQIPPPPMQHSGIQECSTSLEGPPMFINTQIPDISGLSFTADYNSQPPFRTGSLAHPKPRTGEGDQFGMCA